MRPTIDADTLRSEIRDKSVRVLDVRKEEDYKQGHIHSAVNLPLADLLADDSPDKVLQFVQSFGIDDETPVVVYDDTFGALASRVAWTLQYIGHEDVSKLIAAACDAGVKFLNLTKFDDLVLKNGRVGGVVVNWMPVSALPRNITCVDPVALESKMVIDASGHDSVAVKRLVDRKLVEWKGMDPMWVENGEDRVVHKTGEVFPGLVVAGMSVTETYGIPRMGPTYGSMLFSGKKAAEVTAAKIKELRR